MRGLTRSVTWLVAAVVLVAFVGCYTAQVKSASSAVESARAAGKDKECPNEFQAAEALVKRAQELCNLCQTREADALAADAIAKANALCPAKPAPPPPPPSAPSPTASLSAAMAFIDEKEKAVLRVDNPKIVAGREGDHVQIEAVRRDAKTLHVTSVKVLEKYAAKCSVD